MTKKEMIKKLDAQHVKYPKSATKQKLLQLLSNNMHKLSVYVTTEDVEPGGNWNTAGDWFPQIEVNQNTMRIDVITHKTYGHQKKASISTEWITVDMSDEGDSVYIRGEVDCRNWENYKCSGSQKFCFCVFIGDSGHIYTHRAPATKGWMTGNPNDIRKRLRKLGIGATENVIQQGDFLLKPANGNAHPDEQFAHERMGSGHHNFEIPVLYHHGQFKLTEPTTLIHTAVDGIKHPDVIVPAGIWIVGTTANQLNHSNARD